MESIRFNFARQETSPSAAADYFTGVHRRYFLGRSSSNYQGYNAQSRSLRGLQFSGVRLHEEWERHADRILCVSRRLQFSRSPGFVVIPALQRRSKKCFSFPADAQLEEAEVQVVEDHAENGGVHLPESPVQDIQEPGRIVHSETALEKGFQKVEAGGILGRFPQRYRLILQTSLAFVICNMDKVNMSVAVIPMAHQLGWTASTSGLVQSSFFWGYAISQLPGGFLAGRYSGKTVLRAGVFLWSMATALVPITASFLPGLLACRLLVGLGEGVSPPAATDLIARAMPVHERSRAVSFVFGGLNVGSVTGLLLAPAIIKLFGWKAVFYLFGILGIFWCFGFDPSTVQEEMGGTSLGTNQSIKAGESGNQISGDSGQGLNSALSSESRERLDSKSAGFDISDKAIPWRAFFRDPAVWAMMYAHFCGNWGHYNLLSWFPTYFSEELSLDLTNSALFDCTMAERGLEHLNNICVTLKCPSFHTTSEIGFCLLIRHFFTKSLCTVCGKAGIASPSLASVAVAAAASSMADYLISKRVDTTFVRKLCQSIAFVSPAFCMAVVCLCPDLPPWLVAAILTVGTSLSTFTLAGLYCTHQDISPKYASVLLGLTNTVGALPGVFGVPLTGFILDQTNSWALALFAPSMFFYFTGALIWNVFASSEPKDF